MLCVCVLSLSLFGCSKPENNVELKKNVSCQLLDVLPSQMIQIIRRTTIIWQVLKIRVKSRMTQRI